MAKCPECGKKISGDWKYCPNCGSKLRKSFLSSPFHSLFESIEKEFERINKMFDEEILEIPRVRLPSKGGGISIKIVSGKGMKPKVDVRTFGDFKKFEPAIKERIIGEEVKKVRKPPKITEEPESTMRRLGNKLIFEIKVPGVKSLEDVEIRRMKSSIEIKAWAGDKVYFKLFTVPEDFKVLDKKLEKGILHVELIKA